MEGCEDTVAYLLAQGAKPDIKDFCGRTALHMASGFDRERIVAMLLAKGADPNARDNLGDTPMHYAARRCGRTIPLLISKGADVDARNKRGETPLIAAARMFFRRVEPAETLVRHGGKTELKDRFGYTALHWAIRVGNGQLARLLLARMKGGPDLLVAAGMGDVSLVTNLLRSGASVNKPDGMGGTALHWAAEGSHLEVVKLLISRGADVNARNGVNETPLHRAIMSHVTVGPESEPTKEERLHTVEALVDAGADVNVRDKAIRRSPLDCAGFKGYTDIADFLREHGAEQ